MGPDEQTTSDLEASAFFASFINAPDDVIARVAAEADTRTRPDLDAIVAESLAYNFWGRKVAAQKARRAAAEPAERIRWGRTKGWRAGANEAARLPRLPLKSQMLLPPPRIVRLTEDERRQTVQYWRWLRRLTTGRNFIRHLQREGTDQPFGESRPGIAWRREQREFERMQWKHTREASAGFWKRRQAELAWVAISEDRALEIALAAYDRKHPPQGR